MALFNSNRCKICKANKGHRFCMRSGKDICWHDCNSIRIDMKCPKACKYSLVKKNDFEYKTNADSALEYSELLKLEIDKWISVSQETLGNRVPMKIIETEAGREDLTNLFIGVNSIPGFPVTYLKKRLKLNNLEVNSTSETHEDVANKYMNILIAQDWDEVIKLIHDQDKFLDDEVKDNFFKRYKSNKVITKMTQYELISAGLAGSADQAFVYYEINRKYEMTVVLKKEGTSWKISSRVFGKPELINGEMDAVQQIALLLSANRLSDVFELVKKFSAIYADSADIQYYWALYYLIQNNQKKARPFLLNSVEMDPDFAEATGLFATILVQEGNMTRGKDLYHIVIKNNPEDIKSMNNLASIYIQENDYEEARVLLEKCLKIAPEFEYAQKNLEKINSD